MVQGYTEKELKEQITVLNNETCQLIMLNRELKEQIEQIKQRIKKNGKC